MLMGDGDDGDGDDALRGPGDVLVFVFQQRVGSRGHGAGHQSVPEGPSWDHMELPQPQIRQVWSKPKPFQFCI